MLLVGIQDAYELLALFQRNSINLSKRPVDSLDGLKSSLLSPIVSGDYISSGTPQVYGQLFFYEACRM
jgi:hypothetical protein